MSPHSLKVDGKNKTDFRAQRRRFNRECQYGPSFTCVSCCRDLFSRTVVKLTDDIENKLKEKNINTHQYISKEESFRRVYEEEQQKFYLCHSCLGKLKIGKMPAMCAKNLLEPVKIPEDLKDLTDLKKQLIVIIMTSI